MPHLHSIHQIAHENHLNVVNHVIFLEQPKTSPFSFLPLCKILFLVTFLIPPHNTISLTTISLHNKTMVTTNFYFCTTNHFFTLYLSNHLSIFISNNSEYKKNVALYELHRNLFSLVYLLLK